MKILMSLAAVAALVAGGRAIAGDGDTCPYSGDKAAAKTDSGCCSATAAAAKSSDCCSADAGYMAMLPKMVNVVGDKTYDCPLEAKKAADSSKSKVVFMVADTKYEDMDKAMVAYADQMEKFASDFAKVHEVKAEKAGECCMAGDTKATEAAAKTTKTDAECKSTCSTEGAAKAAYMVAGRTVECPDAAAKMSKVALAAMEKVSMTYKVGDKEFCCDQMAGAACKEAKDAKMTYVVSGKEIDCPITARINLAVAKVEAAYKAAEIKV